MKYTDMISLSEIKDLLFTENGDKTQSTDFEDDYYDEDDYYHEDEEFDYSDPMYISLYSTYGETIELKVLIDRLMKEYKLDKIIKLHNMKQIEGSTLSYHYTSFINEEWKNLPILLVYNPESKISKVINQPQFKHFKIKLNHLRRCLNNHPHDVFLEVGTNISFGDEGLITVKEEISYNLESVNKYNTEEQIYLNEKILVEYQLKRGKKHGYWAYTWLNFFNIPTLEQYYWNNKKLTEDEYYWKLHVENIPFK